MTDRLKGDQFVSDAPKIDEDFFDRADSFIHLANEHIQSQGPAKIGAAFLFAASRFNAWNCARSFASGELMKEARTEALDSFTSQFRAMLEDNYDDYVANFGRFIKGETVDPG